MNDASKSPCLLSACHDLVPQGPDIRTAEHKDVSQYRQVLFLNEMPIRI